MCCEDSEKQNLDHHDDDDNVLSLQSAQDDELLKLKLITNEVMLRYGMCTCHHDDDDHDDGVCYICIRTSALCTALWRSE